jgi:hypothetical protein
LSLVFNDFKGRVFSQDKALHHGIVINVNVIDEAVDRGTAVCWLRPYQAPK